jgi:site-specific DNA-methyltransferase (adenine-specific)
VWKRHHSRAASVNKGEWDHSKGPDANHDFNRAWLAACQRVLEPNGSIWVPGTAHVIDSAGFAMQQLGCKLLTPAMRRSESSAARPSGAAAA